MEDKKIREILESAATRSETDDGRAAAPGGDLAAPRRCPASRGPHLVSAGAGTRINHYEVLSMLGQGGTAGVLLARDTRLDRLVALKVPLHRKNAVHRLLGEARTLARLMHENIVMIHDVGASSGHPYMTLEYIKGHTLRELSAPGGIHVGAALEVVIPVVRALVHAHELGIVHRDLKPQNIMIADAGPIKLVDFGLAQELGAHDRCERPRRRPWRQCAPPGTLLYMSPEQLRAEDVDHRSDIWAVGVILHELITGRHPFAPLVPGGLRSMLDLDAPLPCLEPAGSLPVALADLVHKCLRKRREERFSTTRELAIALEKVARGEDWGTWRQGMDAFRRMLARASYHEYGSFEAASRAIRVGVRTLRKHAFSFEEEMCRRALFGEGLCALDTHRRTPSSGRRSSDRRP
jgi:serine/threonine protein kinase